MSKHKTNKYSLKLGFILIIRMSKNKTITGSQNKNNMTKLFLVFTWQSITECNASSLMGLQYEAEEMPLAVIPCPKSTCINWTPRQITGM